MQERSVRGTTSTALAEGALAPSEVATATRPAPPRPPRVRRVLRAFRRTRTWKLVLLVFVITTSLGSGVVYFGPASLRSVPPLQNAELRDIEDRFIAELRPEQNRVVVPLARIPKTVQNAFVAAEDERYWSHMGVDPLAIIRAVGANARGDREGASTITQQYVKNTSAIGARRTLWRKMREAVAAIRLDRRYSKQEILEEYLNSIYLGNGAYGVKAAATLYFGKEIELLRLDEAALLAGITASPARYDPRRFPDRARGRRNYVLRRMRALRMITAEEERLATAITTEIARPVRQDAKAPAFVDWTRALLKQAPPPLGEDALYRGGLTVTTTLDLDIQEVAEQAVAEILDEEGDPEAAVVVIDVATGGVRAMVGGRNRRLGDLNLATQAKRQTGSAFKPVVLATALGEGKTLADRYRAPGTIRLALPNGQTWKVPNYDRRNYGSLSLERATAFSVNTVFAQLIRDVGPEDVVATAKALGITSHLDPVHALTLGTEEISPLELATAYATLAREGTMLRPTGLGLIKNSKDRTLYTNLKSGDRTGAQTIDPAVASQVIDALQSVVRFGTGRVARLPGYTTWGKTGTTDDHADAWFAGGAGGTVAVVWVGYPRGRVPMTDVHGIKVVGSSFPAQIWKRVMTAYIEKYQPIDDELNRVPSPPPPAARPPRRPSKDTNEPSQEPTQEPPETPNPFPLPTLPGRPGPRP